MIQRWNEGFEEEREHLGENQGVPKWLSPNEVIQKLQIQNQLNWNQAKKGGQKPYCHSQL